VKPGGVRERHKPFTKRRFVLPSNKYAQNFMCISIISKLPGPEWGSRSKQTKIGKIGYPRLWASLKVKLVTSKVSFSGNVTKAPNKYVKRLEAYNTSRFIWRF
jgi:hypothetical protein